MALLLWRRQQEWVHLRTWTDRTNVQHHSPPRYEQCVAQQGWLGLHPQVEEIGAAARTGSGRELASQPFGTGPVREPSDSVEVALAVREVAVVTVVRVPARGSREEV